MRIEKEAILKYDVPGPRYTSYPTAPEWSSSVNSDIYEEKLELFGQNNKTVSLYIHIPFCQSMCSFCACNVVIRSLDEKYSNEYLDYLFQEMDLVKKFMKAKKKIKQFHLGGGTPTYLSEHQIKRLLVKVKESFDLDLECELAIEVDPRTIDQSKIKKLRELGFNRISMGVQDFNEAVQKKVNRVQPYKSVKNINDWCQKLGFESINFDLIYGLPGQTREDFHDTVKKVIQLKPNRIALYSFAYVPWIKSHQKKINPDDLPSNNEKLDIFLDSSALFIDGGYQSIAMDHFALKNDELAIAYNEGKLYRNFMGYTVKPADEYIGMGVTSIGFLEHSFIQNNRTLPSYYKSLKMNKLPIERGKVLSEDDQIRQWVINSLMCQFHINKNTFENNFNYSFDHYFAEETYHLQKCVKDKLIIFEPEMIKATELGKIFIRNVCMGFDWYLRQKDSHKQFSKTI